MHGFVEEKANELHAKLILPYADKVPVSTSSGLLSRVELNRQLSSSSTEQVQMDEDLSSTEICVKRATLAIQIYTTALDLLLTSTLPLSEDIWSWEEISRSPAQSLYYLLQSKWDRRKREV